MREPNQFAVLERVRLFLIECHTGHWCNVGGSTVSVSIVLGVVEPACSQFLAVTFAASLT